MRFNPVRFEVRRTDKTGIVTVAGNRYLVGPAWANRQVTLELSHDTITVLDEESRRIIALPRVFGTADATVINPISLLPGLAKKPGAWKNSPLRHHMPDNVVGYLDEADTVTRREFFHPCTNHRRRMRFRRHRHRRCSTFRSQRSTNRTASWHRCTI
ncbi:Mu transposase domain-containing protein, partial [Corynebacterium coyleae]|uniref:Mu transposase domain-containing protein n=1 Tax=Corynebacterium coyleae TaxID=53374 RepID=UPI00402AD75C